MCRYSYISGACANKHVDSTECVGEDDCKFSSASYQSLAASGDSQYDLETDRWLSLFCETHGRFLCESGDDCAQFRIKPGNVAYTQRRITEDGAGTW